MNEILDLYIKLKLGNEIKRTKTVTNDTIYEFNERFDIEFDPDVTNGR